jgi:hypothetical protein
VQVKLVLKQALCCFCDRSESVCLDDHMLQSIFAVLRVCCGSYRITNHRYTSQQVRVIKHRGMEPNVFGEFSLDLFVLGGVNIRPQRQQGVAFNDSYFCPIAFSICSRTDPSLLTIILLSSLSEHSNKFS